MKKEINNRVDKNIIKGLALESGKDSIVLNQICFVDVYL